MMAGDGGRRRTVALLTCATAVAFEPPCVVVVATAAGPQSGKCSSVDGKHAGGASAVRAARANAEREESASDQ